MKYRTQVIVGVSLGAILLVTHSAAMFSIGRYYGTSVCLRIVEEHFAGREHAKFDGVVDGMAWPYKRSERTFVMGLEAKDEYYAALATGGASLNKNFRVAPGCQPCNHPNITEGPYKWECNICGYIVELEQ